MAQSLQRQYEMFTAFTSYNWVATTIHAEFLSFAINCLTELSKNLQLVNY